MKKKSTSPSENYCNSECLVCNNRDSKSIKLKIPRVKRKILKWDN